MKVLYVSKALVVAAYREKLRALAREVDVTALLPSRWGTQPVEEGDVGTAILRRDAWLHGRNHLHVYPGIAGVLDTLRPDFVHIDEEPYSAVTLQLARECRRRGVPCVFFAWQNLAKRLPPPFGALRSWVFENVAGGIAGTPRAAEVLRRAGFTRPLAIIPQLGVDPARFAPDAGARARTRRMLGVPDGAFVLGFGGRLVPEKGVDVLVEALARLPDVRLLLLGAGPERPRLEAQARAAGVAGRVRFAGRIGSLDMPAWLRALDVLALPSRTTRRWSEQFGRILVEAMACAVPVVASDSGEIRHVVGDAGILVAEGDAASLAAAVAPLAADPCRRAELAARGRERVLARFTHERIAAETVAFYRALLPREVAP
ncbi:MAG TPA: glycosyltransferase [Longimicrobiales bacterium]|nr:glycosyltransferase [Longimicrobiales bacterium]